MSVFDLFARFPDEASAQRWFEAVRWPGGRFCPSCQTSHTKAVPNATPMPYWCPVCRTYFSLKTGTPMQGSNLPIRTWVLALYLLATSRKGISSMQMHRLLGITQKTAWHLIHRIRAAWDQVTLPPFAGPVEVDETYIGGKNANKHRHKQIPHANGPIGKTPVVGRKDRATNAVTAAVVPQTTQATLQAFINQHRAPHAPVYTDEHGGYLGLAPHAVVRHSAGEYVNGEVHTNGIESFWALLKRGYIGTYHHMSLKHLQRYVNEFTGRQNFRALAPLAQMAQMLRGLLGKRLRYQDLIAAPAT